MASKLAEPFWPQLVQPHRDACPHHLLYAPRHPILKLIFNSGGAHQKQILLDELRGGVDFFFALLQRLRRRGVHFVPLGVISVAELALRKAQRAQPAVRVVTPFPGVRLVTWVALTTVCHQLDMHQ